jgi:uncharacterized membrane protein YfcA
LIHTLDIVILVIAGCAGGFLAGLLGVGGGVVYVVILTHYFEKMQLGDIELVRFILSNSFFAIFFSSIFGTWQQIRHKNFYLREILLTSATAVVTWVVTTLIIVQFDWYSKQLFSSFFILALLAMAIKMFVTAHNSHHTAFAESLPDKVYPVVGLFTGFFSALSGLGGGVVTVPALSDIKKLKIKKATSISLGVIPFLATASLLVYSLSAPEQSGAWGIGYLSPQLVIPMVAGGIFMAPLGVRVSKKMSEKKVRMAFVFILLLVIIRMTFTLFR